MRHRKFTFKIGRTSAHRKAMMANAVCSLIAERRIKTTVTKGKQIKRMADKMITLGKKNTLHARRLVIAKLQYNRRWDSAGPRVLEILFNDLAPEFTDRNGGYTRLLRTGFRRGDAAEMCIVEFVQNEVETTTSVDDTATTEETPVAEEIVNTATVEETESAE